MKKILFMSAVVWLACAGLASAEVASTTEQEMVNKKPVITFPIESLGNCASKSECKIYCDDPAHREACFAFAEKMGLMNKQQTEAARLILARRGPGSCATTESCRVYCADSAHAAECIKFAEAHTLVAQEKLDIIKKVRLEGGPGACTTREACVAYCSDQAHALECKQFAHDAGLGIKNIPPNMEMRTSSSTQLMREKQERQRQEMLKKRMEAEATPSSNLGSNVFSAFMHLIGF